jgi:magnesium chelatase subunit I
MEKTRHLGLTANESDAMRAAAGEFILEGLYALKRIGRSEELGFQGGAQESGGPREWPVEVEEEEWPPRRRKDRRRNYN